MTDLVSYDPCPLCGAEVTGAERLIDVQGFDAGPRDPLRRHRPAAATGETLTLEPCGHVLAGGMLNGFRTVVVRDV